MPQCTQLAEQIGRWIVILTGLAYVLGFVVENSWLSKFGVYDYRLANSKYLTAGLLYMILSIIIAGIIPTAVALSSSRKSTLLWSKEEFTIFIVLGLSLGNLFAFIIYVLIWCIAFDNPFDDSAWSWVFSVASAMVLIVLGGIRILRGAGLLPVFGGAVLLAISASLFGANVYENVPSQFGGRSAPEVHLIASPELFPIINRACQGVGDMRESLASSDSLSVSESMKLLIREQYEYIFVTICNGEWRSIAIPRSSITAVIEGAS